MIMIIIIVIVIMIQYIIRWSQTCTDLPMRRTWDGRADLPKQGRVTSALLLQIPENQIESLSTVLISRLPTKVLHTI